MRLFCREKQSSEPPRFQRIATCFWPAAFGPDQAPGRVKVCACCLKRGDTRPDRACASSAATDAAGGSAGATAAVVWRPVMVGGAQSAAEGADLERQGSSGCGQPWCAQAGRILQELGAAARVARLEVSLPPLSFQQLHGMGHSIGAGCAPMLLADLGAAAMLRSRSSSAPVLLRSAALIRPSSAASVGWHQCRCGNWPQAHPSSHRLRELPHGAI